MRAPRVGVVWAACLAFSLAVLGLVGVVAYGLAKGL